jgi:hypothetical protein
MGLGGKKDMNPQWIVLSLPNIAVVRTRDEDGTTIMLLPREITRGCSGGWKSCEKEACVHKVMRRQNQSRECRMSLDDITADDGVSDDRRW